jgi:type I restriction enzyme S subunit
MNLPYPLEFQKSPFFILASKQSTNLASINSTQLKAFPIPLPDFNEQLEIESVLTRQTNTIKTAGIRLAKLHSLKTALMQDLLTGKKRVTSLLKTEKRPS